jgi:hypothetical protein
MRALKDGFRATEDREPCQVLTEAAVSGNPRVPRRCLSGAQYYGIPLVTIVRDRVRGIKFMSAIRITALCYKTVILMADFLHIVHENSIP